LSEARHLRIGVSICAIVTVMATCMLPPAHLHTSNAGASIVHRHGADHTTDHHAGSLTRHDHRVATTFEPAFLSQRSFDLHPPLIAAKLTVSAPESQFVGRIEPLDRQMTHGPPIRVGADRAPPA